MNYPNNVQKEETDRKSGGGVGGGGEDSHILRYRCPSEILKRTPRSYEDPVSGGWLGIVFIPRRYQF